MGSPLNAIFDNRTTAIPKGLRQGAFRQLLRLLSTRFGTVPPDVEQRLQALDVKRLEDLVEMTLTANSLEEFLSHFS